MSRPAAIAAIPTGIQWLSPEAAAAPEVLFVGCGKNHAVSVGSDVPSPAPSPVVCAGVAAGTEDVRVRIPHSTSLPEYVWVRETSVGPVVSPLVKPEPNDEYSVHVAAVVEASLHEISAVLCRRGWGMSASNRPSTGHDNSIEESALQEDKEKRLTFCFPALPSMRMC